MYWDIGEMDTVPYILGIAHPPGLPLYTLIGWAGTHLIPFGSVAWRMSVLSALAMAGAAFVLARIVAELCDDEWAALGAALLFAVGGVAWAHATRAEVHAFVTLAFAAILYFLLRWYRSGTTREFFAAMIALGLGVAIHPVVALALPGVIAAVIVRADETRGRVLVAGAALAALCAAVWFAYLPARSAWIDAHRLDPLARYGMSGSAFWNYDDPARAAGFFALVSGSAVSVGADRFGFTDDAFTRGVVHFFAATAAELTPLGFLLGLAGIATLFRPRPALGVIVCATLVPPALFACGFGAESDVERYFLPAFLLLTIGVGLTCSVAHRWFRLSRIAVAAMILALIVTQRGFFNQPHDDRAAMEAHEIVQATPANAVVVATWVMAPPLAYDAYVLHETGRRTIVPDWYGDTENELGGWMRDRAVFVAGTPEGSVAGFHLERMPVKTALYRVVRNR
jgi:4-amino-4-deoxy-L-arabinose transferase-like glycosyltransferase